MARAANATIGALRVSLSADTADFETGLRASQAKLGQFGKQVSTQVAGINKSLAGIGASILGGLSIEGLARTVRSVVADVAKQEIVKSIRLGLTKVAEPSTAGVFPHPDNRHAFVTVRNDNSMLVLDLVTGETLGRVEVQNSPDGVAYSPAQR